MAQIEKSPVPLETQKDDVNVEFDTNTLNFEGDVSVTSEGDGKVTVLVGEQGQFTGKLVDFVFFSSGNTANKWMSFDGGGSTSSDELPLVMPQNGTLSAITFANRDNDVDMDLEIYQNDTLEFTWNIRNKRFAWKTDINGMITVNQGDEISVFLRKYTGGTGDQTAQDPIVEVFFVMTSDIDADSGVQNG